MARPDSENGWRPPRLDPASPQLMWRVVPGTSPPVHLQIMVGQPTTCLLAFAADYNVHVEHLRDGDSGCYTPTNKVDTSNHLNATAMDLNWDGPDGKTFRLGITEAQAYPGDEAGNLRELLNFYEGIIFCGGAWDIRDWMHMQMGYDTWNNPRTADFIRRKIRPDGFSTFRRGAMPAATGVLVQATGVSPEWAAEILPTVTSGLNASQCNTVNRIAMWLAQCGTESAGFSTTEEFASGAEYEGRLDLGNTQPGDGVRFKGRTWIQVTGRSHYAEFSRWAFDHGFVSSPTQFVDNPVSLGELRWAGVGAAWYWTVARPDINALSDAGDVETVSKRINGTNPNTGRANGIEDRIARYARAHALGDQLFSLAAQQQPSGEDMALVPQEQWDAFYHAYMDDVPSLSPLRWPGEGKVGPIHRLVRNIDTNEHIQIVKDLAALGDPGTLLLLHTVASMDLSQFPDRTQFDKDLASQILADMNVTPVAVSPPVLAQPVAALPVVQDYPAGGVPAVPDEMMPAVPPTPPVPAVINENPSMTSVLRQLEMLLKFRNDIPADVVETLGKLIDVVRNY